MKNRTILTYNAIDIVSFDYIFKKLLKYIWVTKSNFNSHEIFIFIFCYACKFRARSTQGNQVYQGLIYIRYAQILITYINKFCKQYKRKKRFTMQIHIKVSIGNRKNWKKSQSANITTSKKIWFDRILNCIFS